jgi:hypothetical protein
MPSPAFTALMTDATLVPARRRLAPLLDLERSRRRAQRSHAAKREHEAKILSVHGHLADREARGVNSRKGGMHVQGLHVSLAPR